MMKQRQPAVKPIRLGVRFILFAIEVHRFLVSRDDSENNDESTTGIAAAPKSLKAKAVL